MGLVDPEAVEQRGEVVREVVDAERPVDDRRTGRGRGCRSAGSGSATRAPAPARPTSRAWCRASSRTPRPAPSSGPGEVVEQLRAVGLDQGHGLTSCGETIADPGCLGKSPVDPGTRRRDRGREIEDVVDRLRRQAPQRFGQIFAARAHAFGGLLDEAVRLFAPDAAAEASGGRIGEQQALGQVEIVPHARVVDLQALGECRAPRRSAPAARPKSCGRACHSACQGPAGRSCADAIASRRTATSALAACVGREDDRASRPDCACAASPRSRRGPGTYGSATSPTSVDARCATSVAILASAPVDVREPDTGLGHAAAQRVPGDRAGAPRPSSPAKASSTRRPVLAEARRACRPGRRATRRGRAPAAGARAAAASAMPESQIAALNPKVTGAACWP